MANPAKESNEVATVEDGNALVETIVQNPYEMTDLRAIESFEDAFAIAEAAFGPVVDASREIGDGFELLAADDKVILADKRTLLMEWRFTKSDVAVKREGGSPYGDLFVSVRAVVNDAPGRIRKVIFNDGSTGIRDQLAEYSKRTGKFGGLALKKGLRVSEYDYDTGERDGGGEPVMKRARTFYLDTSA